MMAEEQNDEEEQRLIVRSTPLVDEVAIACRSVSLTVGEGETKSDALSDITSAFVSGKLYGVLGPSGSGKTSFLHLLGGRMKLSKGELQINGADISSLKNWEAHCGFVTQADHLPPYLTIKEYFDFCCRLRCHTLSDTNREKMVANVIEKLNLGEAAKKKVLIGSEAKKTLSGGEKRRVSVGAELLRADQVRALLLDEPLSGLDSKAALQVIDVLQNIATEGRVVILSLHQPSTLLFSKLSKVVCLNRLGQVSFFGSPEEAQDYFDHDTSSAPIAEDNPVMEDMSAPHKIKLSVPEVMLEQAGADGLANLNNHHKTFWDSDLGKNTSDLVESLLSNSNSTLDDVLKEDRGNGCCCLCCNRSDLGPFSVQAKALISRSSKRHWRNNLLFKMHLFMTVVSAFVISALWAGTGKNMNLQGLHNRMGVLFFISCFLGFSSLSALGTFISERQMFMRERKGRMYSPTVYFLVEVLMDILFLRILPPIFLGTIVYWPVGLRTSSPGYFLTFLVLLVLGNVGFTSASMFMSAASPSMPIATFVGALFMLLFLAFGGIFLSIDSLPKLFKWMPYITPSHFAYDGMIRNELLGQAFKISSGAKVAGLGEVGALIPGKTIIAQMGFSTQTVLVDVIGLLLIPVLYLFLGWAFMQKGHRL